MLAKDQTRLRIEKMEADRRLRRQRTRELRIDRAAEEKRNISKGNPGDVDFIGLVGRWREDHEGMARPHDYCDRQPLSDEKNENDGAEKTTSCANHDENDDDERGVGNGSEKICVCVRKRPLNSKERKKKEHDAVTCLHPTATVHSAKLRVDGISKYCDHNTFRFDHAFDEDSTTEEVYRYAAAPLVRYALCRAGGTGGAGSSSAVGGGGGGRGGGPRRQRQRRPPPPPRATVFAYGQTGSGKTHTMGGIQRMVAEDIYRTLSNNAFDDEERSLENTTVSVAMFEIYGGRIQDLLNGRERLRVLEDGRGEVVVSGLREFEADGPRPFLALVERGAENRTTVATEANDESSRSHAICQVNFRDRRTGTFMGKLSLVDLAGSERGNDTKSHDRRRRTESSEINTSLLALKECIRAIDGESRHVPYRQSKLTLILKDCFVARSARTAMIATLSPGSSSTDHTVNTLRYADRIKEKKVGNVFSPSKRSPTKSTGQTSNKSPMQLEVSNVPTVSDDQDDYDGDDFDELEEIMNAETSNDENGEQTADGEEEDEPEEQLAEEIDRTVKELFEEEEHLLNLHMTSIHENASLLTEEGTLLNSVQGDDCNDCDMDRYATRLGEILEHKTAMIHSLQDRLGSFRELLRKEEELSGVRR